MTTWGGVKRENAGCDWATQPPDGDALDAPANRDYPDLEELRGTWETNRWEYVQA